MPNEFTITPQQLSTERPKLALISETEAGHFLTRTKFDRIRRVWSLSWEDMTQADYDYAVAFFEQKSGPVETFLWTTLDPVPPPIDPPVVAAVAGGTQAARNVDAAISFVTGQGETTASPLVVNFALALNEQIRVTAPDPFPANVTAVRVYLAITTNPLQRQTVEIVTPGGTADYDVFDAGTLVPAANTATEQVTVRIMEETLSHERKIKGTYRLEVAFKEVFP